MGPTLCPVRRPCLQGSQARPWEGPCESELTRAAGRTACGRVCARPAVTARARVSDPYAAQRSHAGSAGKARVT